MGREVLHYSFYLSVRNSLHTGLSSFRTAVGLTSASGNTCKSRGILPIERQKEKENNQKKKPEYIKSLYLYPRNWQSGKAYPPADARELVQTELYLQL